MKREGVLRLKIEGVLRLKREGGGVIKVEKRKSQRRCYLRQFFFANLEHNAVSSCELQEK